jgi:hypothetical protein
VKNLITPTLCLLLSVSLSAQIKEKVDYTTDIYLDCDSVVVHKYNNFSKEDWANLSDEKALNGKQPIEKKVFLYANGILTLEKNYDWSDSTWVQSSEVSYDLDGRLMRQTTYAIVGDKRFPFEQEYNLDYLWTTKIAPNQILPAEKAGKVLFDDAVMQEYEEQMLSILNGEVEVAVDDTGNNIKQYYNVDKKLIREETAVRNDTTITLLIKTNLNRETTKELTYSLHGDLLKMDYRDYQYKYAEDGQWRFMLMSGWLHHRRIY